MGARDRIGRHDGGGLKVATKRISDEVGCEVDIGTLLSGASDDCALWAAQPVSYIYQWQRQKGTNWTNIVGAIGTDYTVSAGDVGLSLRIVVHARNQVGSADKASAPTPLDAAQLNAVWAVSEE